MAREATARSPWLSGLAAFMHALGSRPAVAFLHFLGRDVDTNHGFGCLRTRVVMQHCCYYIYRLDFCG